MREIENDFFTLYKSVDAICRDLFRGEHYYNDKGEELFGLSAYIKSMEEKKDSVCARFPEWNEEYKTLKRMRWLRTQIAHSVEISECGEADLDALECFYQQLLSQTDILARASRWKTQPAHERRKAAASPKSPAKPTQTPSKPPKDSDAPSSRRADRRSFAWLWILVLAAVIAVGWRIVYIFWH